MTMSDTLLNAEGWEALANLRLRRLVEVNAENARLTKERDDLFTENGRLVNTLVAENDRLRALLRYADDVVIWEHTHTRAGFQEEIEDALGIGQDENSVRTDDLNVSNARKEDQ